MEREVKLKESEQGTALQPGTCLSSQDPESKTEDCCKFEAKTGLHSKFQPAEDIE